MMHWLIIFCYFYQNYTFVTDNIPREITQYFLEHLNQLELSVTDSLKIHWGRSQLFLLFLFFSFLFLFCYPHPHKELEWIYKKIIVTNWCALSDIRLIILQPLFKKKRQNKIQICFFLVPLKTPCLRNISSQLAIYFCLWFKDQIKKK